MIDRARLLRLTEDEPKLGAELQHRMQTLIRDFDARAAREVGAWIVSHFRVESPKTPKGGKALKQALEKLVWVLRYRLDQASANDATALQRARQEVAEVWADLDPHVPQIVAGFTDEGGKVVPAEVKAGSTTYQNKAGLSAEAVKKYAQRLEGVFGGLRGWRAKALQGGLTVVLAAPGDFSGTAGGKYKSSEDALYVRTTPAVLKRSSGYASFDYILVHELGHRYERFNRLPVDFDRPEWWTTRYSKTEGLAGSEAFAELFALGHFGLRGDWDRGVVDRFEKVMG